MNDGIIIGQVIDPATSHGIEHISVALNHVQVSQEMGPLPLHNLDGGGLVQATTDGGGYFVLGFRWDPIRLGMLSSNPAYQLNLNALVRVGEYPTARLLTRHTDRLVMVVSLRAIADGRIPDLRSATSSAKSLIDLGMRLLREMRHPRVPNSSSPAHRHNLRTPNMFLSPGRPSAEFYALLGATQIRVPAPAGAMSWD
jgi:hypothetical protein